MHYLSKKKTIVWQGKTQLIQRQPVLLVEDENGEFKSIMLSIGKVLPDNWVGDRIKITIEKI